MKIILSILAAVAVIGLMGGCAYVNIRTETKTLTAVGKESVSKSGGGHEYRVYSLEDTYVIKDSWLHARFDSSRLYGRLQVPVNGGDGSVKVKLRCEVTGIRIPFFSRFQNILDCTTLTRTTP
jgi:hypothetical protein